MKLSIVIPAYNEEDRIVSTLERSLAYLEGRSYSSEIVVVSDGSSDGTVAAANGFSPGKNVTIQALEYHPNRGKGYATRYGMLRASGDLIMFMDADYSVPMNMADTAMDLIRRGHDIAIASRAVSGAVVTSGQGFFRALSGKMYTLLQNLHLGISYKDTQCGFKMFTRTAARTLFSQSLLNSVIFAPEILWMAKKKGFKTAEFPVTWTHHEDSRIQYDSVEKFLFIFRELFSIKKRHSKPS